MLGAAEGFAVIAILIGLGVLLAQLGVLDETGQQVLSRLVYVVATPALLVHLLQGSDLSHVFGARFVVAAGGVLAVLVVYVPWARLRGRSREHVVVGSLAASYANAGYLGLPIATFVLHDATFALPTMVLQLVFYAPAALALLQLKARRATPWAFLRAGATNPVSVAAFIGVALSLARVRLPEVVGEPVSLVGAMAVPSALIAYGVSLRLGPRIGVAHGAEAGFIAALKLLWQPAASYLLARYALDLHGTALAGVTVMAALPTAQNVFIYASRFDAGVLLARDTVGITTALSLPVLFVLAALLVR